MKAEEFIKEKLIITKEDWLRAMEEYAQSELEKVRAELANKEDKLDKCMQLLTNTDAELKQIVRKMLTPGMGSIQEDATKAALLKEFEKLVK